jgi:hypothetical protein
MTDLFPTFAHLAISATKVKGEDGKQLIMPQRAQEGMGSERVVRTLRPLTAPSTGALAATDYISCVLDGGKMGLMRDLVARFRVSVTSHAARIVPTPFWFSRIEVLTRDGKELQRVQCDSALAMLAMQSGDAVRAQADAMGWDPARMFKTHPQAVGESRLYHLPLKVFWSTGLHYNDQVDGAGGRGFEIRFYPMGQIWSAGIGGSPVISLDSLVFEVDSVFASPEEKKAAIDLRGLGSGAANFLDCQLVPFQSQTLNAATNYTFQLLDLKNKSAGLLITIQSTSGSNNNLAQQNWVSLDGAGSGEGLIDLQNPMNESLFGGGTALPASYFRRVMGASWFCPQFVEGYAGYLLAFADDIHAGLHRGEFTGLHQFDGSAFQLALTTPAAGTSEVQTLTLSAGTAASGTYCLGWTDPVSGITSFTTPLAYTATASTIQTAFNALESVQQQKFTVALSGDITTSPTATFTALDGSPINMKGNLIQVSNNTIATSAPANLTISVARTTFGVPGWVNGTYNVNVYSFNYRRAEKLDFSATTRYL